MILKIEKREEIHHQFQKFLTETSKPTNDYELKIANRLFGEKTYLFLQVSFAVSTTSVSGIHKWPNALVRIVGSGGMLPKLTAWLCPHHWVCPLPALQTSSFLELFKNPGSLNLIFALTLLHLHKNVHGSTQNDLPRS